MINLLIADDHNLIITGVKAALAEECREINVIAEISNPGEILPAYKEYKPDVVLCDIMFRHQKQDGFVALAKILEFDPAARVIMVSQYDQIELIQKAYDLGAKAFLNKNLRINDLITAINNAAQNEIFFTDEIARQLAAASVMKKPVEKTLNDILTEKEIEQFILFAQGFSDKEVAEKYNVTVRSVQMAKAMIKDKLNVTKTTELTIMAIKYGLITV